jgi:hypothetical protein
MENPQDQQRAMFGNLLGAIRSNNPQEARKYIPFLDEQWIQKALEAAKQSGDESIIKLLSGALRKFKYAPVFASGFNLKKYKQLKTAGLEEHLDLERQIDDYIKHVMPTTPNAKKIIKERIEMASPIINSQCQSECSGNEDYENCFNMCKHKKIVEKLHLLQSRDEGVKVAQKNQNLIPGGMADGKDVRDIARKHDVDPSKIKDELLMGVKVEMEHTDDDKKAVEIARRGRS